MLRIPFLSTLLTTLLLTACSADPLGVPELAPGDGDGDAQGGGDGDSGDGDTGDGDSGDGDSGDGDGDSGDGDGDSGDGDGDSGDGDGDSGDGDGDGDSGDGDGDSGDGDGDSGDGDGDGGGPCTVDADCSDGVECTVDRCTPQGCVNALNDGACNDGIACTVDRCTAQGCVHQSNDGVCDDDLYCNGDERCSPAAGGCVRDAPPPIDDGIACTRDACDEDFDRITHVPINARCDNGQFCDGTETCNANVGCVSSSPPPLSDGIPCTNDVCNEQFDRIDHVPNDGACSDGQYCNGSERCIVGRGCAPGQPPPISDGIDCTVDRCNEQFDRIDHVPNDGLCDDRQFCNGNEICSPFGGGCLSVNPPNLDDGIPCTLDSCDEGLDRVVHDPINARCNDGNDCTRDTCDVDIGCENAPICGMPELLIDSVPNPGSASGRMAGDACGTMFVVGPEDVTITHIAVHNDLATRGNLKFLIFDHDAGDQLVYQSAPMPVPDDGGSASWKMSETLAFTLRAGGTYDISGIADVDGRWSYDTSVESGGGLTTAIRNPNVSDFAMPFVRGHGGADCGVQLFTGSPASVLLTAPGEAYGHHGACEGWNGCGDADTCALWACQYRGFADLDRWGVADVCPTFDICHLFNDQNNLDENWGNWCDVMGVGEIYCF